MSRTPQFSVSGEEFIDNLIEENKKLKSDLAYERTMLDNVKAEYKSQVEINKKLKEELEWYKKQYGDKPLTTIEEINNHKGNTIWL